MLPIPRNGQVRFKPGLVRIGKPFILARNPVVCCPIFKRQETINHEQRNCMLLGVRGRWPLSFKINHWKSYDINMISFIHQLSCVCDRYPGISQFAPFCFMLEDLKQHETTYVHSQHLQPQPIHSPFASKAFKSIGSASSYCLRCFFALLIGAKTGLVDVT